MKTALNHLIAGLLPLAVLAAMPLPALARDAAAPAAAKTRQLVYFGTHGSEPGKELFGAWFDPRSGMLTPLGEVAQVYLPTWLTVMPGKPVLFSVSEAGNDGKSEGRLFSFSVDRATGKLTPINDVSAGGGGTTHLDYDPLSHSLFAANFGSGSVTVAPVSADGRLGEVTGRGQNEGTGPQPRQKGPHAHGATVAPGGQYVLVPDLGADRTFVWRFDPKARTISANEPPFAQSAPGTGPRHVVFGRSGRFAYLNTELTAQVVTYDWDAKRGTLTPIQTVDVMPASIEGRRSGGEIAVSDDGRFLYVSDREGESGVGVFAIDQASGKLTEVQHLQVGERPWSFALAPGGRWLLIAEEGASNISIWARDSATGKLSATGRGLAIPKPVSVAFMR
ncbi:6-phosphogluconolactonase [Novosphingobium sp. PhB165]|uniref:lactonase family protein n=1 Tax=Novosphingobium sp. PhB165 TaxID=2485105 RepID=UPI0010CF0E79|nr:lactonase family protein [Novosphingobium sp. PhB165]TCM16579.1 6-phosphogluconolactonase [Novosphingobium sp. PhB165]